MKYEKPSVPSFSSDTIVASHKGVEIEFTADDRFLIVESIESKNKNRNDMVEALALLREHFSSKRMLAVVQIDPDAASALHRMNIETVYDAR